MKQKLKIIVAVTLMLCPMLLHAASTTWESTGSNDLTNPANWSAGVPNSTTTANFDSTLSGINTNPTDSTADFSALNFNFLHNASDFTFNINSPYSLTFTGAGITGTNTNTTIDATNAGSPLTLYQIGFSNTDSIPTTAGNATLNASNSGTITGTFANDMAQIFFDGSGGYSGGTGTLTSTIDGNATLSTTNTGSGVIGNLFTANDIAQILFDGSGGSSSNTVGPLIAHRYSPMVCGMGRRVGIC